MKDVSNPIMNYENIDWEEIKNHATDSEDDKNIKKLKSLLEFEELQFLLKQISRLNDPKSIKKLSTFQNKQKELGAWVDGLFPDQFINNDLFIPDNFSKKIKCMLQLAKQRKTNIDAIQAMGEYTLNFQHKDLQLDISNNSYPDNWEFKIDFSVMENTLKLFNNNSKREEALKVANLKVNQQMLKHRKDLGYLPEPVTNTEDLVELLLWSASDDPIDLIWKWLNPLNIFELADVYNHQAEFSKVLTTIKNNQVSLKKHIFSKINDYINLNLEFNETFALTFGFAIRGWATNDMFGLNIENIKDDYNKLISIIAHELFHRLQTKLCSTTGDGQNFSDLVSGNMKDKKDNKFYKILSYIMLEGTGEYITHQFDTKTEKDLKRHAIEGLVLLEDIYIAIYNEKQLESADEMLNQGLKSNGVFYSLGEYITKSIVEDNNKVYLGRTLNKGVFDFFLKGEKANKSLNISEQIMHKIKELKLKK